MTSVATYETQPRLEPGTPGWWRVYGARPQDIRIGDLVVFTDETVEVATIREAKSGCGVFITTVGDSWLNGFTLGYLNRSFAVVRQGTHNMLAGS